MPLAGAIRITVRVRDGQDTCIEDEELRSISPELRDAGYEVEEVADGQAGLTAILLSTPIWFSRYYRASPAASHWPR